MLNAARKLLGLALVAVGASSPALAQTAPANLDFESGPLGQRPTGWGGRATEPYSVTVVDSGAFQGRFAVLLAGAEGAAPNAFATLTQRIDVTPMRGMRVRYRAFARANITQPAWGGLWLRVDRPNQQVGLFDNMQDRPITNPAWTMYEITGEVANDATALFLGALLAGPGRLWLDSVTLETLPPLDAASAPPPAPAALAYLDSALRIMELHSVNRQRVDWPTLKSRARLRASGATGPAQTYPAIRAALSELEDGHSFFLLPRGTADFRSGGATWADTNGRLVDGRFGYLRVPFYSGGEPETMRRFATAMHETIRQLDRQGACGWVVDLRGNSGGNMWPMLAGIGPILGEGIAGSFVAPEGPPAPWSYRTGASMEDTTVLVRVERPYRLRRPGAPVAVLTDSLTASSGEIIAVSFRGRNQTRSFGRPTAGVSSANEMYQLPDSAMILLTVSLDADRTGRVYGGRIEPDENIPVEAARDAPLDAATRWLAGQCRR